jgi:hypothetical protein
VGIFYKESSLPNELFRKKKIKIFDFLNDFVLLVVDQRKEREKETGLCQQAPIPTKNSPFSFCLACSYQKNDDFREEEKSPPS